MSRKDDVTIILEEAKRQYQNIRKNYDRALKEKSMDLRVPVKNLMENLRSSLDYMAHDIYESCCQSARLASGNPDPRNIYFPYGLTEQNFRSGVGSSLPNLLTENADVYNLIESIQPFKCNDNWLYDLCSVLNEKKHDKLKAQIRTETERHHVESEHGSVSIIVNDPNVKITSQPGAVKIFGVPAEFSSEGIRTAPSDKLKHSRITWVSFTFEDTEIDVIGMLEKSMVGITALASQLYTNI